MKLGIIGTGKIAETTAPTLAATREIECYAVASRTPEKAQAFAEKYGFQKAYGSYEALLQDPEVELVYIATPHSHHYEHMMLAIGYGKHVICEKPFTLNKGQAEKVRAFAKEKEVYLAEAIWTRYMPVRKMLDDILNSGIIGKVHIITANLSYADSHVRRIMEPELAGGALMDVGVYGINFLLMHFGADIERIESSVKMTASGVDGWETITVFYKDGPMGCLTHSFFPRSDRKGCIFGEKGYITVQNINCPQSISVYDTQDVLLAHYPVPEQISGYEYEFQEAVRCIREGKTEADSMPLEDTLRVLEITDSIRKQWGLVYPKELE